MPYACDPSSLPKYPPNKEMDAKYREEARRYTLCYTFMCASLCVGVGVGVREEGAGILAFRVKLVLPSAEKKVLNLSGFV